MTLSKKPPAPKLVDPFGPQHPKRSKEAIDQLAPASRETAYRPAPGAEMHALLPPLNLSGRDTALSKMALQDVMALGRDAAQRRQARQSTIAINLHVNFVIIFFYFTNEAQFFSVFADGATPCRPSLPSTGAARRLARHLHRPRRRQSTSSIAVRWMSGLDLLNPSPLTPSNDACPAVVAEIEERQRFLEDMEALGRGSVYRTQIAAEISQVCCHPSTHPSIHATCMLWRVSTSHIAARAAARGDRPAALRRAARPGPGRARRVTTAVAGRIFLPNGIHGVAARARQNGTAPCVQRSGGSRK